MIICYAKQKNTCLPQQTTSLQPPKNVSAQVSIPVFVPCWQSVAMIRSRASGPNTWRHSQTSRPWTRTVPKMGRIRATGWLVVVFHQAHGPHPEKKKEVMFVKMGERWSSSSFKDSEWTFEKKLSGNHLGQYMCQGSRTQLQKYWGWVYPSFK